MLSIIELLRIKAYYAFIPSCIAVPPTVEMNCWEAAATYRPSQGVRLYKIYSLASLDWD